MKMSHHIMAKENVRLGLLKIVGSSGMKNPNFGIAIIVDRRS